MLGRTAPEQLARLKTFAGRRVTEMQFRLFEDQVLQMSVFFDVNGSEQADEVKRLLTAKYGAPDTQGDQKLRWEARGMQLVLEAGAVGLFNTDLDKKFTARSREAEAKAQAARQGAAQEQADKQAKAAEERKMAEAMRPKTREALHSTLTGPMLCMINGRSKPTLYMDLGGNDEFKLVRDGIKPVVGKWGGGTFQGQDAIILSTPRSSDDNFPDLYTVYEDDIKFTKNAIGLTMARRSTFPGSRSADAYEAVCEKSAALTLEQARQLTGANLKNNPLRPEALANRQQEQALRPSAGYCARLEDGYADRPALRKRLLAEMGCN